MRYANLHKRNSSKMQVTFRRVATVSMLSLILTSFIVLPLTSKAKSVSASNNNQIEEIANDYMVLADEDI